LVEGPPVKITLPTAAFVGSLILSSSPVWALKPYVQLNVGAFSRDVEEKDASIAGSKAFGTADSTRIIAKIGMEYDDMLDLYFQGGGASLSIDEFDNYDGSMDWAYGGGLRFTFYRAPYRDGLRLFVEGSALRYTTDDSVSILVKCTTANGCAADDNTYPARPADETIQWNEYALMLGASARFFEARPYGGIRLSKVDGTDRIRAAPDSNFATSFQSTPDLKEQDNFGVSMGLDFYLDRAARTVLNFQVSLIDQNSIEVGLRRTF
jgi:hypothetical protein